MAAYWRHTVITVPSSTGTVAYTPWGTDTPQMLVAYGTNWLTEDTAVTTTGTGIYRGMAAPQYNSPSTLIEGCAFLSPAGDQHITVSTEFILTFTTAGSGTVLFHADAISLDVGGFTLDWDAAASGGYKVLVLGLFGVGNVGAFSGTTNQTALAFGYKAGASLLHGAPGGPNSGDADRTYEFYGGGAYPGTGDGGWSAAGMTCFTIPGAANTHLVELHANNPTIIVASGGHFVTASSFATANIVAAPTGTGLTNMTFDGDAIDGGMLMTWDDEDTWAAFKTPGASTGNTATVSGLSFAPGLVLGYSVSDEPQGQGTSGRGAAGFSVATDSVQWTAIIDGVSSRGSYQSFQRGFSDCVDGTDFHAGTIELTNDGFIMTTEEDDSGVGSWVYHAFGHPLPAPWIPQIVRYA